MLAAILESGERHPFLLAKGADARNGLLKAAFRYGNGEAKQIDRPDSVHGLPRGQSFL